MTRSNAVRRFATVLAAGLMFLAGCTTDRDDPPPRGKSAARQSAKNKKSGRRGKKDRDPVNDMFFGIGKKADTPDFAADDLNERERGAVKASREWQDDEMRELRSQHERFNEQRKSRKRWVYGFKPED